MTYSLGRKSLSELVGVHPDMVRGVKILIKRTPIDFAVHDGLRTMREQREYVRRGASRTLRSKHLKQADGYGHAVDLVPYVNGKLRWEWDLIYPIMTVARDVFEEIGVPICWGGRKGFRILTGTTGSIRSLHDGWDGPHVHLGNRYRR